MMKKTLLFFMALVLCLCYSCSKSEDKPDPEPLKKDPLYTSDGIWELTRCRPIDVELIETLRLFVDEKSNARYLYGSKMKDGKEVFWVSKFTESGEYLWEVIDPDKKYRSKASMPYLLDNGNLVLAYVLLESDIYSTGMIPTIVSAKDGSLIKASVYDGYIYSDVTVFEKFFFCTISDEEIVHYPKAEKLTVQIDNEGKIIRQAKTMNVPDGTVIWLTDTSFIQMNAKKIEKGDLIQESEWTFTPDLPKEYQSCKMELSLNEGEVVATYYLTLSDTEKDTRSYRLSLATGKKPVKVEGVSVYPGQMGLVIGNEATLIATIVPEDATIKRVTWSSSDENIATVNEQGVVKALNKGECIITATTIDGNYAAHCKVSVKNSGDVNGIYLNITSSKILQGKTMQLLATVTPATALNKNVKWYTSSSDIASVDENGLVTAHSIGSTLITAVTEEGNYKAECYLEVTDITRFIALKFEASSIINLNGYITGSVFSCITNQSSESIELTGFMIVDSSTNRIVALTSDPSLLGTLLPGKTINLGSNSLKMVYYPKFIWQFTYDGKPYEISHQFGSTTYSTTIGRGILGESAEKFSVTKK